MKLDFEGLGKRYGRDHWALREFSLSLAPGIVGLLGPNGAGKSTLMKILATVSRATEGRVLWNGEDIATKPDPLRRVLGYLPQDFGIYPNLTALEFLDYLAAARGLSSAVSKKRIEELLALVNLSEAAKRAIGGYSGGMRQRLGIAQALLNDPKLLIVDEPTVGLDPEERNRFRHLLTELAGSRIVLLSTHIVSDVEATAESIALIHRGRLVAFSSPEELMARASGQVWEWSVAAGELPDVRRRHRVSGALRRGGDVLVRVVGERPAGGALPATPTLEDAYLCHVEPASAGSA
ncbi:MAG TPA: ABC transporter ATP-binding protein [Candidatus Eisenbacteria bacterium]